MQSVNNTLILVAMIAVMQKKKFFGKQERKLC